MMQNDDNAQDQKQQNNVAVDDYKMCSLHQFFNLKQITPNIFDLRSIDEFKASHVIGAINIADPMKKDKFDVNDLGKYPIVVYGNNNNKTNSIINHLINLIKISNVYKDLSVHLPLYVFKDEYNNIYEKYPFFCGNNMTQYPNMILYNELYLGDGMMAENKDIMINLGITHIVNVTKMDFMLDNNVKKNIKYLKLSTDDTTMDADKMSQHFDNAVKFIDNALINNNNNKKNRCFVHCMAGVSRSASIVIAYLMASRKYSLCNAYIHVKKCRPRIGPNVGFLNKLIEYETKLFGKSTNDELREAWKTKSVTLHDY